MVHRKTRDSLATEGKIKTRSKEKSRVKNVAIVDNLAFKEWVQQNAASPMPDGQCQPSALEAVKIESNEQENHDVEIGSKADATCGQQTACQILKNSVTPTPTEVLIIADQTKKCGVEDRDGHLKIHGDFPSLFATKLQEIATQLKELCGEILCVSKQKIGLTPLLDVTLETGLMTMGWRMTLPDDSFETVTSAEFVQCIQAYTHALCSPLNWSDKVVDATPANSPVRLALLAARNGRSTRGGCELPDGTRIVCGGWKRPVMLGMKIGSPPEKAKPQVKHEWNGAFRGYHYDDREAYFSVDCRVQSKSKKLLFPVSLFEKIKALSGRDFTRCTVRLIEHRIGEDHDHYELVEILGEIDDLFGTNSGNQKSGSTI